MTHPLSAPPARRALHRVDAAILCAARSVATGLLTDPTHAASHPAARSALTALTALLGSDAVIGAPADTAPALDTATTPGPVPPAA